MEWSFRGRSLISLKKVEALYLDQGSCCESLCTTMHANHIILGPASPWSCMWCTHSIGSDWGVHWEESDRPGRAQTGLSGELLHAAFQPIDEAYQHDKQPITEHYPFPTNRSKSGVQRFPALTGAPFFIVWYACISPLISGPTPGATFTSNVYAQEPCILNFPKSLNGNYVLYFTPAARLEINNKVNDE